MPRAETNDVAAALPWWPEEQREPLSRRVIVRRAIQLIDDDGLDELSMRKLAQSLDVAPASLYGHVATKEQLLVLVLDEIFSEVDLTGDTGTWQADMRAFARAFRVTTLAHPETVRLVAMAVANGPNALRVLDRLLGILRAAGFTPEESSSLAGAYAIYLMGFSLFGDRNNPMQLFRASDEPVDRARERWRETLQGLPADVVPNLAAVTPHLLASEGDGSAAFELGLEVLIVGTEAQLARAGDRRPDHR